MEFTVRRGRGYETAESRLHDADDTRAVGVIHVDASFSPINRISYTVEDARVEQRTDLNRLVIDIESNGSIDRKPRCGERQLFCTIRLRCS